MKTTIYELLGMIKDDVPVKRILFKNQVYEYDEDGKDYYNEEYGWVFDEYDLISILNEPIEILETTITYKPDKIKKLDIDEEERGKYIIWSTEFDQCTTLEMKIIKRQDYIINKINEIIEAINER